MTDRWPDREAIARALYEAQDIPGPITMRGPWREGAYLTMADAVLALLAGEGAAVMTHATEQILERTRVGYRLLLARYHVALHRGKGLECQEAECVRARAILTPTAPRARREAGG